MDRRKAGKTEGDILKKRLLKVLSWISSAQGVHMRWVYGKKLTRELPYLCPPPPQTHANPRLGGGEGEGGARNRHEEGELNLTTPPKARGQMLGVVSTDGGSDTHKKPGKHQWRRPLKTVVVGIVASFRCFRCYCPASYGGRQTRSCLFVWYGVCLSEFLARQMQNKFVCSPHLDS
eukprot:Hpha_TRINITY_DN15697_c0_g1::TRINITY_DN15697_c0_g1_i1::g.98830::m.98830